MSHSWITAVLAILPLCAQAPPDGKWEIRFFHDTDKSTFVINDLQFPSVRRGVAVGALVDSNEKVRPTALVTSDGGATWSFVPTKEVGLRLFFLNEGMGWMVTEKGLWRTLEAGRSWEKLNSPKGMLTVHFADENRGWAAGLRKSVHATTDGGKIWNPLPEAAKVVGNPEFSAFGWIEFQGNHGMIVGWSRPPRREEFPAWMDPESAKRRRERPTLTLLLQTQDGGKTWLPSQASVFGRITKVRLRPDLTAISLVQFQDSFDWPAEVFRMALDQRKTERIFRQKDRAVTDIALSGKGGYLAAFERPGVMNASPIPGKLKILKSEDLNSWQEMQVDYRAFGRSASFAGDPDGGFWVGTDSGMILKLSISVAP